MRRLEPKEQDKLREVCKALSFPLSGHETKPQLTRKIKEVQAEREALRQATLDLGRDRGKTYEWVCDELITTKAAVKQRSWTQ